MGADEDTATGWDWHRLAELLGRIGIVLVFAVVVAGVLAVGARFASVPGLNMLALEVAGSSVIAEQVLGGVSTDSVLGAIKGDFAFIGCYTVLLCLAAWYFPSRAFRVRRFRESGPIAAGVIVFAGLLDAVENLAIMRGLHSSGDLPWRIAAVVAWPKFTIIAIVALYVIIAVGTFLATPRWLYASLQADAPLAEDDGSNPPQPTGSDQHARFGIAASGGGVRSASLVLGSLQALDDAYPSVNSRGPSWTTAGKITAVSGGSYIAGGFSVARSERRRGPDDDPRKRRWSRYAWRIERDPVTGQLSDSGGQGPEERWLLTRLGYLLAPNPNGSRSAEDKESRDAPGVIALVAVGALLNLTVLTAILWLVVQPYAWLLAAPPLACSDGWNCLVRPDLVRPVAAWAGAAAIALLVWVGSGWVLAALSPRKRPYAVFAWFNQHGRWGVFGLVVLTAVLAVMLLIGPTLLAVLPSTLEAQLRSLTPAALVAAVGAGVSLARGLTGRAVRFAPYVGGALFLVLLTVIAVELLVIAPTRDVTVLGRTVTPPQLWAVQVGAALLLYSFVSAEWWSMAGYYRSRLRLAYATYRTSEGVARAYRNGSIPRNRVEPSIYELWPRDPDDHPDGSPLLVCATAHATGPSIRRHYGLPAVSVTIDPEYVRVNLPLDDEGRSAQMRASTRVIENLLYRRGGARLTTMLAVGVSGAAISPAMGQYRIGPTRALLAAANVRLGVWMPNPRHAARFPSPGYERPPGPYRHIRYPRPRVSYLLKEMFGVHDIDDVYLYVTDGGHWENTGLVELLRNTELDEVVCLDADDKPRETVSQIANAINLAQLECGVRVRLSLDPLRGPADGGRGGDYSPQSVAVGLIERGDSIGLLWYAKPVLTASTPLDLLSYAECDAAFPTTSTIDQFFHTSQFKAYRDLGRYNARTVVIARYELARAVHECTWDDFRTLATEPGAHWVVHSLAKLLDEDSYRRVQEIIGDPAELASAAAAATSWPRPAPPAPPAETAAPAEIPIAGAGITDGRDSGG